MRIKMYITTKGGERGMFKLIIRFEILLNTNHYISSLKMRNIFRKSTTSCAQLSFQKMISFLSTDFRMLLAKIGRSRKTSDIFDRFQVIETVFGSFRVQSDNFRWFLFKVEKLRKNISRVCDHRLCYFRPFLKMKSGIFGNFRLSSNKLNFGNIRDCSENFLIMYYY